MTGIDLAADTATCARCGATGAVKVQRSERTGAPLVAYLPDGWTLTEDRKAAHCAACKHQETGA